MQTFFSMIDSMSWPGFVGFCVVVGLAYITVCIGLGKIMDRLGNELNKEEKWYR